MSNVTNADSIQGSQGITTNTVICVSCPCGCEMTVSTDANKRVIDVKGNECARGRSHAEDEVTSPVRVITMTLCVAGALEPLSVKTAAPIPKSLMKDAALSIKELASSLHAPIANGEVLYENICGTGIPVIATKSI